MRIVIQERDRRLLRELAVTRLVDSEQAKCIAGFGSTTRANCRLLALTKAGLLRRFFLGTTGGGKKALYALSQSGAKLVEVPYRGPRRKADDVLIADFFVTHQLAVNQIYCQLKCQPIPVSNVRFLRWVAFHRPLSASTALIPDGYFEVATSSKLLSAFVEVDLGHESLRVWKQKIQSYLAYAVSGDFQDGFNNSHFRVLVIANSERRMQSIRSVVASATEKIFWLSTIDSINRDGCWSSIWLRPKGDQLLSLIERT
jgi:hypothetical protein